MQVKRVLINNRKETELKVVLNASFPNMKVLRKVETSQNVVICISYFVSAGSTHNYVAEISVITCK